jgi:hypothetical protein
MAALSSVSATLPRKQRREVRRAKLAQAAAREQVASQLVGPALGADFSERLADWRGLSARQTEGRASCSCACSMASASCSGPPKGEV